MADFAQGRRQPLPTCDSGGTAAARSTHPTGHFHSTASRLLCGRFGPPADEGFLPPTWAAKDADDCDVGQFLVVDPIDLALRFRTALRELGATDP